MELTSRELSELPHLQLARDDAGLLVAATATFRRFSGRRAQLDADPEPEARTPAPYVDGHVEDRTAHDAHQFRLDVRVEAAKELLTTTDRPVATIAFDVGFKNLVQGV